MVRSRFVALIALTLLPVAAPASAQDYALMKKWCYEDTAADRILQGCDAVLKSGRESKEDLAIAHYNLGSASLDTGRYDAARQEFDQAIKFRPDYAAAFGGRGLAFLKLGQLDAAIADYSAALVLRPGLSQALFGRGVARRKTGDVAGGDADIAAARAIRGDIDKDFAKYGVSAN